MVEQGKITKKEYETAMSDDVYGRIKKANENQPADTVYSYFVDALIEDVLNDLIDKKGYSESDAYKMIYQGGLTIISTQNMDMQTICDEEANDPDNYPSDAKYSKCPFELEFQSTTYKLSYLLANSSILSLKCTL